MARSVLASAIRDKARELADDTGGNLLSDNRILVAIDLAWARLYSFYVQAEPDRFRTEATITTTGASAYNLPADWFSTVGLDWQQSSNIYMPVRRMQESERNMFNGQPTGSQARAYRVLGSTIALYPTPPTGQTYRHIYLPTATAITTAGDSIDCRIGHEDYLEKVIARDLLRIEQNYNGEYDRDIESLEDDLKIEASMRYFHEPTLQMPENAGWLDPADVKWGR